MPSSASPLALANSIGCTPTSSVPTSAVPQEAIDESSISSTEKPEVSDLLIFDATANQDPDLVTVGPYYGKYALGITDSTAIRGVASWDDVTSVLKSYSRIEHLYLLTHGVRGYTWTGEVITRGPISAAEYAQVGKPIVGGEQITMSDLAAILGGRGMPEIGAVHLDGCNLGLDVAGLYSILQCITGPEATAWPLLIGFAHVSADSVSAVDDQVIQDLISSNAGYVLGTATVQSIRADGLVLTWLTPTDEYEFPTETGEVAGISRLAGESLSDYRERTGHFRRDRANKITLPSSDDSNSATAAQQLLSDLEALGEWVKSSKEGRDPTTTDPYIYVTQVEMQ